MPLQYRFSKIKGYVPVNQEEEILKKMEKLYIASKKGSYQEVTKANKMLEELKNNHPDLSKKFEKTNQPELDKQLQSSIKYRPPGP